VPAPGLVSDVDIFAAWTHWIATHPLGQAYRTDLAFPPVMVYVFWLLGVLEPAFRTATDSSELVVRLALKLPAVIADAGLALAVGWLMRRQPRWAVVAAVGVLLSPVVVYTSAWWGQYEAIYVLAGLVAASLAIGGRPTLAAVALGVALMAKPQALAFIPPFAAWILARYGWGGAFRFGAMVAGTVVVLWLPFVMDDGPGRYLATLGRHQGQIFAILSLRAWNPWWIFQTIVAGDAFLSDGGALIGPISPRILGYLLVGLVELVIVRAVLRAPTARGLLLGLAASVLVLFALLTSVHERYAYGALLFLAPLIPDRRVLATWLALTAVMTLNLLAAVPPTAQIGAGLPIGGPLGIAGSVATIGLTVVVLWLLGIEGDRRPGWDRWYDRPLAGGSMPRIPSAGP
jgi:Gpi18-like mannosyltransferase